MRLKKKPFISLKAVTYTRWQPKSIIYIPIALRIGWFLVMLKKKKKYYIGTQNSSKSYVSGFMQHIFLTSIISFLILVLINPLRLPKQI